MSTGKKFDFIFVDGRFRRRALKVAREAINPEGVVFLHDADREYYYSALKDFPYSAFLSGGRYSPFEKNENLIWVGSMSSTVIERLVTTFKEVQLDLS